MLQDTDLFGDSSRIALIKEPSAIAKFGRFSAETSMAIDERVIDKLTDRVMADQHGLSKGFMKGACALSAMSFCDCHRAGIPQPISRRLHKDVISLTLRLVFDITLMFEALTTECLCMAFMTLNLQL